MSVTRIAHIDAWRFIAVAMVIIFHVLTVSNPWYLEHLPWIIMGRAQPMGLLGVKIFFCISGFVICRALLAEAKLHGAISMKAFYVRRFLRIVPPLLLYMLALALLIVFNLIAVTPGQFARAGLFHATLICASVAGFLAIPGVSPMKNNSISSSRWSLSSRPRAAAGAPCCR